MSKKTITGIQIVLCAVLIIFLGFISTVHKVDENELMFGYNPFTGSSKLWAEEGTYFFFGRTINIDKGNNLLLKAIKTNITLKE